MRCAIYLRISDDPTGKQAGVDRQRDECQAKAERLGWDVVEVIMDNDLSAYSGKPRPGFDSLLKLIADGKIEAVVCWHTDRLYRRLPDLVRLLESSSSLEICTVEGGDIDLSTASGRMVASILGSVAANESEHHAERRQAANKSRAVDGHWCKTGSRPFGYDNTGTPLEPEASMIRKAVPEILGGKSLHAVAREWNDSGVTTVRGVPWTNLHVRRVLTNPRVAALRVHRKEIVGPGKWEALVDPTTWQGLTAFLSNPDRKNAVAFERRYLLSGVAVCGVCRKPLYSAFPHGKDRARLYVCKAGSHVGRNAEDLEAWVERTILPYLLGENIGADLRRAENNVDFEKLSGKREALVASKSELATLLRKRVLSVADVEREAKIIDEDIARLDEKLSNSVTIHPLVALLAEDGEDPVDLDAEKLVERWNAATPDRKGKAIKALGTCVVYPTRRGERIFNDDTVDFEWIDYNEQSAVSAG
jgi:DNA invertase Pin-like site-specific DNA recombinase